MRLSILSAVAALAVVQSAGAAARSDSARLPMAFEANRGQVNERAKFLSRCSGYTLFLTPQEAVLALPVGEKSSVLRLQFEGSRQTPLIEGVEPLPGTVNYFRGSDPAGWLSKIPTYERVRYSEIYEGIDLVFYGNEEGRLEYDFIVAPGADPNQIRLRLDGADEVRLGEDGLLVARLGDREVVHRAPAIYQQRQDQPGRDAVLGRYVLGGDNRVGFEVEDYDADRRLVIDPVLVFSSFIGGDRRDHARGIDLGPDGSVYIFGETGSVDFPVVNALQPDRFDNFQDAFVMKLNPAGTVVIYATYLGGSGGDLGLDIAVNAEGCAYVVGTAGTTFPVTPGAFQTERTGPRSGYVAKISADGSQIDAATLFTGRRSEEIYAVALDTEGYPYITGYSTSDDLPTTPGSYQPTRTVTINQTGVFVAKLMPDLSGLVYSTHIDSPDFEDGRAIDVYEFSAYITGSADSDDYPTTPGVVQPLKNGAPRDSFVTKLSPDGSSLVYSTFIGGDNLDIPHGIAVGVTGSAYITGDTTGFNYPTTPGAFVTSRNAAGGAFVTKLSPDGSSNVYSTYLSERAFEHGDSIKVDRQGAAYVVGLTNNVTFPVTSNALQPMLANRSRDAFLVKLSYDGSRQLYSSFHGGDDTDSVGQPQSSTTLSDALAVRNCQAYFVGRSDSPNFPLMDPFQATLGGGDWDAFVSKVDPSGGLDEPVIGCNAVVLATGTPVMDMLAPRSIGTVFGTGFSTQTVLVPELDANGDVSTNLANTCVEIAGLRGAVFAVLSTQINFMVPPGVPLGWRRVVVIRGCGTANEVRSEPQYVEIKPVVPAFFNFVNNVDGVNPIAAVDNATGFLIGPSGLFGLSGELGQNFVTTPAQPGQIIVVFPTGLGSTNPALANGQIPGAAFPITGSSSLTLGGVMVPPEDIFYVGAAPCCAGLDQVTFRVPAGLAAGNHQLVLTVDGVSSPVGPFIAVQP